MQQTRMWTSLPRHSRLPSRGFSSWIVSEVRAHTKLRNAVLALLLLTYVWRFHDLSPILSPLRLAAVATVASWCLLILSPRSRALAAVFTTSTGAALVLWFLWMGVGAPSALAPSLAIDDWLHVHLKTLTMFLFVVSCMSSLDDIKRAMVITIFGAAILALFYAKGGFPLWGSPVPMYDVNDLALHLNMALPFVLFFTLRSRKDQGQALLWGLIAVMALGVLMTRSRGGFLTLGVICAFILFGVKGIKPWLRLLPPLLLAGTFVMLPPAAKERLSTIFNPTEDYNYSDEEGRMAIWTRGMQYMLDHSITGVGVGNFYIAERELAPEASVRENWRGRVAHNSFVEAGAETGIPGLLLFVTAILTGIGRLLRQGRRLERFKGDPVADEMRLLTRMLALSLSAFCVGGFFLSMAYMPFLFVLLAMAIGLDRIVTRHASAARTAQRHSRAVFAQTVRTRAR